MRSPLVRALFVATALVLAGAGGTQPAAGGDADIGGDWHFRFPRGRGAAILHFPGTPQFGVFEVRGAGYTTLFPQQAFTVSNDSVQTLAFDSTGSIHGVLALEDPTRTSQIGQLTIDEGTLNATNDRVLLRGTLALGEEAAKKIVLVGDRRGAAPAGTTGRTFDGRLAGARVRSAKYSIEVYDESTTAPGGVAPIVGEGYPFFQLRAGGPARVDGVEVAASRIDGLLVADVRGVVCGRVITSDFGPGVLRGRFVSDDPAFPGASVFHGSVVTDGGRRVRLTGVLGAF